MAKKFVVPLSVTVLLIAIVGILGGIKALQIMAMIQAGAEAGVPVTTVSAVAPYPQLAPLQPFKALWSRMKSPELFPQFIFMPVLKSKPVICW